MSFGQTVTRGGYLLARKVGYTLISVVPLEEPDQLSMRALDIVKGLAVQNIAGADQAEAYHLDLLAQEQIAILAFGSASMQRESEENASMPHHAECGCRYCYWG